MYNRAKRLYTNSKSNANKLKLQRASKDYKKTINFYINKYKFKNAKDLRNMERNDPKSYWNYLKKLSTSKPAKTPTLDAFYLF